MTSIVDDVVAIKARLEEIRREKDAALNKQEPAPKAPSENSAWNWTPVPNLDGDVYC